MMPKTMVLMLGFLLAFSVGQGKPPEPAPLTLPGEVKGEAASGWHAPFVHFQRLRVGKTAVTSVRWLSPDGKVLRERASANLGLQPGFVYDYSGRSWTIFGINGDWQLDLPKRAGPGVYSIADGRVFYHQHHPAPGKIAVDIYVAGKFAGTIGPYWQWRGRSLQHGDDGSMILQTWKDVDKQTQRIIAVRPTGAVRFHVDCDADADFYSFIAPDARGILLNPIGEDRNTFTFHSAAGKGASFKPGFSAHCHVWLPDSATALLSSGRGEEGCRYHLVDWTSGKQLWNIPNPSATRISSAIQHIAVTKDLLLFTGRELVDFGVTKEPVRYVYAVDIKTGKTVARWRPVPMRASQEEPWFCQRGAQVYLMTPQEFSEINFVDIAAKKRGWK